MGAGQLAQSRLTKFSSLSKPMPGVRGSLIYWIFWSSKKAQCVWAAAVRGITDGETLM